MVVGGMHTVQTRQHTQRLCTSCTFKSTLPQEGFFFLFPFSAHIYDGELFAGTQFTLTLACADKEALLSSSVTHCNDNSV